LVWEDSESASIRESGNLAIGVVLSSARETPEGAPMHSPRLSRLAEACRLPFAFFIFLLAVAPAASAATLTGRVIDPDGRGVAGVRVAVTTSIGTVANRETDADGAFEVTALTAGSYEVRVLADGFQADPIAVTLGGDETRALSFRLRLSAIAESIVVSAAQIDMPLSRAADSVTVITAADLEARQIETVADALRLVPGLAVTRSGGRGALTALFPRGGASNYTLVLVDGIRANSFGGGYDFAHLSVADVDRIEIVRGPESALFGSDAIGAVVQVVTRRGGRPRVDGLIEGGNQGTARATIGAAGSHGDWSWGGGAERTRSLGYTGIAPASGEAVSNDDYHLSHVSGTLGWQHPNGADFMVSGNLGRDERGFPGPFGSNPIGAFTGVDRISRGVDDTRQIGSRFTHPWSSRVHQRLEANFTDLSGDFINRFGRSSSGTRRFDGRVQEDLVLSPAFGASAGVELLRERGSSTYVTGGAADEPIPIRRGVTGTFGELRYVGRERLLVTGGLRLEHITRDAVEANVGLFSSRPAFPDQTVDSLNPKISASYLIKASGESGASTRVRASGGTGIRPPDAFEIAFTDNPNLKPERSRSFDVGVDQQLDGGAYSVAATGFVNRYDDLIITITRALQDASRYKSDNISNARSRGLELQGTARLTYALRVRASYTLLHTEILSVDGLVQFAPPPFKVGDALIRRPRHQGSVELTYDTGRVTAFGDLTTRSQMRDVEPNSGSIGGFFSPGYSVINVGASVRVARGLDLYTRVLNLADRAYEETLGFPALRRSGIVGVRIAASR
jgi:outer membrane cobalamin receptor